VFTLLQITCSVLVEWCFYKLIGIALGASIPFNQSMLICERLDVIIIKAKGLFFVLCKPARLTALLMVISVGRPGLLKFVHKYGRQHASPNSGYPESALAGILDCRFGGTHTYFGQEFYKPYIGNNPRELTTNDVSHAIRINILSEVIMVLFVMALYIVTLKQ